MKQAMHPEPSLTYETTQATTPQWEVDSQYRPDPDTLIIALDTLQTIHELLTEGLPIKMINICKEMHRHMEATINITTAAAPAPRRTSPTPIHNYAAYIGATLTAQPLLSVQTPVHCPVIQLTQIYIQDYEISELLLTHFTGKWTN
jgi:hypothetical protein